MFVGVFMMRQNAVIGGQTFSASFPDFMEYRLPIQPDSLELYKEGLFGALTVAILPFILFWIMSRIFPIFLPEEHH